MEIGLELGKDANFLIQEDLELLHLVSAEEHNTFPLIFSQRWQLLLGSCSEAGLFDVGVEDGIAAKHGINLYELV